MEKVSSQQLLKSINQQKVLHLIYTEGPITRVELAERTGLTQQTVTNVVNRLLEENLVAEGEPLPGKGGRKPIPLTVRSSHIYAVGIEVAVKYVRGSLMNFQGEILQSYQVETELYRDQEQPLRYIAKVVDRLLPEAPDLDRLKGIGCSIQGLVDAREGVVIRSPGLGWRNFPLKRRLEEQYRLPVYIENDVNLLALIENLKGRLARAENSMILKLDYGIGGAVIIQNQLYAGSSHVAGEFGHYKAFAEPYAYPCHCGSKGCLTTLASVSGLKRHKHWSLEDFSLRLEREDPGALSLLGIIQEGIGLALCNIVTFLNPDHVLLTGKILEGLGDRLIPFLNEKLYSNIPESCRNVKLIVDTKTGDESVLAANLVVKHFFEVPLESLSL